MSHLNTSDSHPSGFFAERKTNCAATSNIESKKRTMSTSMSVGASLAAVSSLLFLSNVQAERIYDFKPSHSVHDVLNIARDLRALGKDLSEGNMDFNAAYKIYSEGGYSESIAKLDLLGGLPFFLDEGTEVTGKGTGGEEVTGVALKSYDIGEKIVELLYTQSGDGKCYVGGLNRPELLGCFAKQDEVKVKDQMEPLPYIYNVEIDNYNNRTLQKLSIEAKDEFTLPDGEFTEDFPFFKFEEYYGTPDYADQILRAAFRGTKWESDKHVFDFSGWTEDDRAYFVEYGTDYMNVAQHILGRLEKVNLACQEVCHSDVECNPAAQSYLDEAVAFYTGAFWEEGDEGNMLYGLADRMCKEFKTCGWHSNSTEGTSHVNLLNFQKFNAIQHLLSKGKCEEVHIETEVVARMAMIPLWQGLLEAVHTLKRHHATAFALSTLPILAHCSPGYVEQLFAYYLPDSKKDFHFPHTKKILEDHYHCIKLDCVNMGGLWAPHKGE